MIIRNDNLILFCWLVVKKRDFDSGLCIYCLKSSKTQKTNKNEFKQFVEAFCSGKDCEFDSLDLMLSCFDFFEHNSRSFSFNILNV